MRGAIQAAYTGLRYQCPIVAYVEQRRESIAFTVLGRSSHRFIGYIFLFVARFSALPSNHRVTLRRKKRGSGRRKIKAGRFPFNHHTGRFAILRHLVAKSYVIITQLEHDVQFLLFRIFQRYSQFVSRIIYRRTLDTVLRVRLFHLVCLLADKTHLTAEVANIGYKAERRILQDGFSVVCHRIDRLAILQLKVEFQARIRAGDHCLLGKCLRGQQCQYTQKYLSFHKYMSINALYNKMHTTYQSISIDFKRKRNAEYNLHFYYLL